MKHLKTEQRCPYHRIALLFCQGLQSHKRDGLQDKTEDSSIAQISVKSVSTKRSSSEMLIDNKIYAEIGTMGSNTSSKKKMCR